MYQRAFARLTSLSVPKTGWKLGRGDDIDDTLVAIEPLGGGTRYEVYRAWDRALFVEVAAKVLRPGRVGDNDARASLAREVEIARGLAHPNLVRLLRNSVDGPRPYLVYEWVGARSVQDHLVRVGALRVPDACLLGIRACAALLHLHERGILHLDVKPANITTGDPPKLLDLSVARRWNGDLRFDRPVGTDAYMAPEQCAAEPLTPATDLFGLGATLYEAVTAMEPFSAGDKSAAELAARYPQLVEDPLPIAAQRAVPPSFERTVLACLARDPRRRPASALDVAVALDAVLAELGLDELRPWPRGVRPRTS